MHKKRDCLSNCMKKKAATIYEVAFGSFETTACDARRHNQLIQHNFYRSICSFVVVVVLVAVLFFCERCILTVCAALYISCANRI